MLHYIIQTVAFQFFFLIIYDVFLRKETFFNWNRAYLLVTTILSLVIPFIKISSFKTIISQNYMINLPEVFIGKPTETAISPITLEPTLVVENSFWTWESIIYLGIGIATIVFIYKLIKLLQLLYKNPKERIDNIFIVNLMKSNVAFSFFNYVFLGEQLKKEQRAAVLKHEMVHVKQKHTLDLLFFELLRILFWFNPLIYIYQSKILSLHEFIADDQAVKTQDKSQYYQSLLSQVFETKNISFINPFFKQSLIKKRIVMLSKSKSKRVNLLKYVIIAPVILGMLIYVSCEKEALTDEIGQENLELSQYSYSLKKGEKMVGDKKEIHTKYEDFLKKNKDYVSWTQIDRSNDLVSYSVHHITEKVPENLSKSEVNFPDGSSYTIYINWTNSAKSEVKETEESKRQKEKELLKLKEEYKNALEVPFSIIDEVPLFPGCEGSNKEQKKCMSMNVSKHVNINFNTKLAKELGLKGRQRINVIFKIDKNGDVIDVRSRAKHPGLEAEAIRVINTLPKFKPGIHNGKTVNVPYSLPIIFQVTE
ncbi:M56 family metallopeptidase [Algibacter sp. 2305UL17-15]|uniref:M56 family metallopeptidase n=1 Tax=Algibacter sp. 2305UL17-15 TaxID=3231268 RepID=UPI003457F740